MSSKPQFRSPPPPQQQPSPPPYSQGQPPHRPPPSSIGKRKDLTNTIVLITILIVVISVVLATALYFLVSGSPCGGSTEPNVNLDDGVPTGTTGEWRLEVASVSTGVSLGSYTVSVLNGTTVAIAPQDLQNVMDVGATGISGGGLTLSFYDITDDNKLNRGDYFILSGTGSLSDYQVVIYWKSSGNKVSGSTGMILQ